MKREILSLALDSLADRHISDTAVFSPGPMQDSPERIVRMKKKRIIALALAAALLLSFSIVAYAGYQSVATPQAAERVAREQLQVWKEMGILSPEFELEGEAYRIGELEERTGNDYWYGRLFPHRYQISWAFHLAEDGGPKYGCCLNIDTLNGKIVQADLYAAPDADEPTVGETTLDMGGGEERTVFFYENFDDIFPADMTVDRFCSLLADYWGFSGYTLAETVDEAYYDAHWDPVAGDSLLKDMPKLNPANYYLTVFFEGDQEGAPIYVSLGNYPGYVGLHLGISHGIG